MDGFRSEEALLQEACRPVLVYQQASEVGNQPASIQDDVFFAVSLAHFAGDSIGIYPYCGFDVIWESNPRTMQIVSNVMN